jgi:hypothetical protein
MKFLLCLRKVLRTFACVQKYLPGALAEVKDLTGVTREFIEELKDIWFK